jgi:hypothetical protein
MTTVAMTYQGSNLVLHAGQRLLIHDPVLPQKVHFISLSLNES